MQILSHLLWQFTCALLLPCASECYSRDATFALDAQNFNWWLTTFLDKGGGYKKFVDDVMTKVIFHVTPLKGTEHLSKVANAISERFRNRLQFLRNIYTSVASNTLHYSKTAELPSCCKDEALNRACTKTSGHGKENYFPTISLEETFKQNERDMKSNITSMWQYFVTTQGVTTIYPSSATICKVTNVMQRQWFVSGSRQHMDLVIVLDWSRQMVQRMVGHFTMWELGRWVVRYLLTGITPFDDRVAVVGISSDMKETDDGMLKVANKHVKKSIEYHLRMLKPSRETVFLPLLQKAINVFERSPQMMTFDGRPCVLPFTYLNVSYNDCTSTNYHAPWCATTSNYDKDEVWGICSLKRRTKVLAFISGSKPYSETREKIKQFVHDRSNSQLKDIKIMTFGLGEQSLVKSRLVEMSSNGGLYIPIVNPQKPNDIRLSMLPYSVFFAARASRNPFFSMPYKDRLGHGIIVTMSQAVYDNGTFLGVIGIDMNIADLLREFIYTGMLRSSYFFVMSRDNGYAVFHPMAPPYRGMRRPKVILTKLFEPELDRLGVLNEMASIDSGYARLLVRRTIAYGQQHRAGMKTTIVNATFTWTTIDATNFSLCLVAYEGADEVSYRYKFRLRKIPFLFHAYSRTSGVKPCNLYNSPVNLDQSAVRFDPCAFEDPFLFAATTAIPTRARVKEYTNAINGISNKPIFKENVKEAVLFTSLLDGIWTMDQRDESYSIWRYIITHSGVLRAYPGIPYDRMFTYTASSLYSKALATPGDVVLSGPYIDDGGAGIIFSVSRALLVPGSTEVFAVVTMEMPFEHAFSEMLRNYSPCHNDENSCILLNRAGYVALHDKFMVPPQSWSDVPRIENNHITRMEPAIATDMIRTGLMNKTSCFYMGNNKEFVSYLLPEGIEVSSPGVGYSLTHVKGTDTFLVVVKHANYVYQPSPECICSDWDAKGLPKCVKNPTSECECPCYRRVKFIRPNGTFIKDGLVMLVPLVLTAKSDGRFSKNVKTKLKDQFKPCFTPNCRGRKTERDCHIKLGCRWCSVNQHGAKMGFNSYCGTYSECYFGMIGHPGPYGDYKMPNESSHLKLVLYMLASFALITLIAVGTFMCRDNFQRCRTQKTKDSSENGLNTAPLPKTPSSCPSGGSEDTLSKTRGILDNTNRLDQHQLGVVSTSNAESIIAVHRRSVCSRRRNIRLVATPYIAI